MKRKILLVAGARPNFIKVSALSHELEKRRENFALCFVEQHSNYKMSSGFWKSLHTPKVKSYRIRQVPIAYGKRLGVVIDKGMRVLQTYKPTVVVVVGDVDTTLGFTMAAVRSGNKIAHVEAGLRSFDWSMPEEVNRILVDRLSNFHYCSEQDGVDNLAAEGIDGVVLAGNVMADTLWREYNTSMASAPAIDADRYGYLTLHRPSNVDNLGKLTLIMSSISKITLPIVFPCHPRTRNSLRDRLSNIMIPDNLVITDPLPYHVAIRSMNDADFIITDSGGVQEEASMLGVHCFTLRSNTERPCTLVENGGSNRLMEIDNLAEAVNALGDSVEVLVPNVEEGGIWDGNASERIVNHLIKEG
jgi:UDP-N-acetylglucosamine 2-epimerase (non-hydrolysing)